MRVLLTLYTTAWGGAEESVLDLAGELEKNGVETVVLFVCNYAIDSRLPKNKNLRFHLLRFRIPQKLYSMVAPFLVFAICVRYNIRIVNLNWRFVRQESRFLRLIGVKIIATVRAILLDKEDCSDFQFTDAIIGVSKAVIERIVELGYNRRVFTIYNGIDFRYLKLYPAKYRKANNIISISRLVSWKRIDWSIKAVNDLHRKGLPISLDIYGDGPERDNLAKLINELDASSYIKLKGFIDINDYRLRKYGIFLAPSLKEPFGKTIVENVVRGKVVVGSKSGGIPELLPNYPLLFCHTDYIDYVRKLELAYKHFSEYQKLVDSYKNDFLRRYNIKRVVKDYMKIYNLLV